ncbi:metallophosphoesterase [Tatumella citrea]|uniref:Calcineurin-like phosphoesterase domain-containing protein n=1 Tax=Tatumella citrea TaxID=53336 RepID=A0A1Y0LJX3_TATCI|nr:metallophosphoesterase [Tatumella citrea]ARU93901.1 hypothetical protein A7K98_09015 [Tatumella citrea]ARU97939.1 hypothetical protein A7K99_09015 [Tatumella citrea]
MCELSAAQWQVLAEIAPVYQLPEIGEKQSQRLRVALLADPQFADISPDYGKGLYYPSALKKLPTLFSQLNAMDLDLVVTLGDIIDREWQDYQQILPLYDQLKHPHLFITGNHDAAVISRQLEQHSPVLPLPKHYFALQTPNYRLLALDGNDISFYATSAQPEDRRQAEQFYAALSIAREPQAQTWNGGIGQQQYLWLEQQLKEAHREQQQVIVMGHFPLAPAGIHRLWNGEQIAELLTRHQVVASFHGHDHRGSLETRHKTRFVTLRGLLDGASCVPFMVADFSEQGMTLTEHQILITPDSEEN